MKLQHIAGEKMFVDFAEKKPQIIDKPTGGAIAVEVSHFLKQGKTSFLNAFFYLYPFDHQYQITVNNNLNLLF